MSEERGPTADEHQRDDAQPHEVVGGPALHQPLAGDPAGQHGEVAAGPRNRRSFVYGLDGGDTAGANPHAGTCNSAMDGVEVRLNHAAALPAGAAQTPPGTVRRAPDRQRRTGQNT